MDWWTVAAGLSGGGGYEGRVVEDWRLSIFIYLSKALDFVVSLISRVLYKSLAVEKGFILRIEELSCLYLLRW